MLSSQLLVWCIAHSFSSRLKWEQKRIQICAFFGLACKRARNRTHKTTEFPRFSVDVHKQSFSKTLTAWLHDQARHNDKSKTAVTDKSIVHTPGKYTYPHICVNAFPWRVENDSKTPLWMRSSLCALLTKKGKLTKDCWCREYLSLQQSTMAWYFLQGIASIQSQTNLTALDFFSLFTGKRLANFNPCFSQLCSLLRQVAVSCMRSSEYFFMHCNQFSHLICGSKQNSF